jgi:hypothetical protein
MINKSYQIDYNNWFDEGGSAEFYPIKNHTTLGFKQFRSKKYAINAYNKQKLLAKYGLSPQVHGKICRLEIKIENFAGEKYTYTDLTGWGYITEKAKIFDEKIMKKRLPQIQDLVENIEKKTKLKFWDCHYYNMGYVNRYNKAKLVCIDTGNESFERHSNAWGYSTPGPKCGYCLQYQCKCGVF